MVHPTAKMGFWSVVSLVIGSQVGSGVFMLPGNLAKLGAASLFGWVVAGVGAVSLALIFAQLCLHIPKAGGPHAYVEAAFGKKVSFFTSWTYWLVSWVSTTVVVISAVGYLLPIVGPLSSIGIFWLQVLILASITALNFRGVGCAGTFEIFLTILKCTPLILVPVSAFFFFEPSHFASLATTSHNDLFTIISQATLLCFWGFIGIESATVTAGVIENPRAIVPKAVVFGTITVAVLYILNSVGIMGLVPLDQLAVSTAPYADAVKSLLGNGADKLIALIASLACIGTLNAWTLMSAQMAYSAAQDGVFPPVFGITNKHGAPVANLLISFFGMVPLLALAMNNDLLTQLGTIIDISVTVFLLIYGLCMVAYLKMFARSSIVYTAIASLGLIFSVWAIFAASITNALLCLAFTATGIPIYWWKKK